MESTDVDSAGAGYSMDNNNNNNNDDDDTCLDNNLGVGRSSYKGRIAPLGTT